MGSMIRALALVSLLLMLCACGGSNVSGDWSGNAGAYDQTPLASGSSSNTPMAGGFLYQIGGIPSIHAVAGTRFFLYGIAAGTGALMPLGETVEDSWTAEPTATASNGQFLYVTDSVQNTIWIRAVDPNTGALAASGSVSTLGIHPTRMLFTAGGFLFVYGPAAAGFELVTFAVDPTTGALTPTGTMLSFDSTSAVGFAATPDGRILYVIAGDLSSNAPSPPETLTAYSIDPSTGALTAGPVLSWTLPGFPNAGAPTNIITIDPLERYLYLMTSQSTAFQPAVTVLPYSIDPTTGALTPIGTGTPVASEPGAQGIAIDPSGRYMYLLDELNAGATDNTVTALAIDQSTGAVSVIGSNSTGGVPVSIVFDPSGQHAYVSNYGQVFGTDIYWNEVAAFAISTSAATAGQLIPIGSPNQLAFIQGEYEGEYGIYVLK